MKKKIGLFLAGICLFCIIVCCMEKLTWMCIKKAENNVVALADMGEEHGKIGEINSIAAQWETEIEIMVKPITTLEKPEKTEEEKQRIKEEIQQSINQVSKKYGAVGVSVALIENGEVCDTWQYGYAIKNTIKMSEESKIRLASISKVILAMNVMRLAEENVVDLDESIGTYWGFSVKNPAYADKPVNLRSILTHTSSIADLETGNMTYKLKSNGIFRNVEPSASSSWSYCNFAFGVAGATIEKAAGKSIFQISKEYFFEPMDLDVAFAPGRIQNTDLLASLYYANGSLARSREEMCYYTGSDTPGNNGAYMMGGVCASAKDLAELTTILINDGMYHGKRYLTEQSVVEMETVYCKGSQHGVEFLQCMPLDYTENIYGEEGLYFHTGSSYGVYNLMSYNPQNKNGVIVLTTGAAGVSDEYGIYAICGEIAEILYGKLKGE